MSEVELPGRIAASHRPTMDDIRELVGGATPHFALQLRNRLRRLVENLPSDDPVRIEAEQGMKELQGLAIYGEQRE